MSFRKPLSPPRRVKSTNNKIDGIKNSDEEKKLTRTPPPFNRNKKSKKLPPPIPIRLKNKDEKKVLPVLPKRKKPPANINKNLNHLLGDGKGVRKSTKKIRVH